MSKCLEEVGLCLGSFGSCRLNHKVVNLQRLCFNVTKEGTDTTGVSLEVFQTRCNAFTTANDHFADQVDQLITGTRVGGRYACALAQELGEVVDSFFLCEQNVQRVGKHTVEVVITVSVGCRTGVLNDAQVCIIQSVQDTLDLTNGRTHRTEGDLEVDGVNNACFEIKLIGLVIQSTRGAQLGYLPVGAVIVTQAGCLGERQAVIVTCSIAKLCCVSFFTIIVGGNSQRAAGVHTVQVALLKSRINIIPTGGVNREAVFYPLTGSCPLFATNGVEQLNAGVNGRGKCRCTVLNGIYNVRGGSDGVLGFQLDNAFALCIADAHILEFLAIDLVGVGCLVRHKR